MYNPDKYSSDNLYINNIGYNNESNNCFHNVETSKKSMTISFKVAPDMKSKIQQHAAARGQTVSAYMLNKALENDLERNIIVERTEILEGLNTLKGWHSDDKKTCQLIEKIAKKVEGI